MLATIRSGALVGVEAVAVEIEVNTGEFGELEIFLVGLPDTAVKESKTRVISSLINTGLRPPETVTTINLAPGDLRKEGAMYDLPIAVGLAASTGQISKTRLPHYLLAGELGLSGQVRAIRGGVALAAYAKRAGLKGVILPRAAAQEAALIDGVEAVPVDTLDAALRFLSGEEGFHPLPTVTDPFAFAGLGEQPDFSEVKGQLAVRRAVEIAAAGGHNLLLIGPPGSGKSLIAKRIPSILPTPDKAEFLEILAVHSAAGMNVADPTRAWLRPFRSPHHTISDVGMIGGGAMPTPGEVSLAHRGVLFLDELPEFRRSVLEVLRQPLEDGSVTVSRAAAKVTLPSRLMLVAAMNPCPCGYLGDKQRTCRCGPTVVQRYRGRISGPLLDRIDLQVEAPALSIEELRAGEPGDSCAVGEPHALGGGAHLATATLRRASRRVQRAAGWQGAPRLLRPGASPRGPAPRGHGAAQALGPRL